MIRITDKNGDVRMLHSPQAIAQERRRLQQAIRDARRRRCPDSQLIAQLKNLEEQFALERM